MSPDPQSPLEPSPGESVANTFQPGAHADACCGRTPSGEMHSQNPWRPDVWEIKLLVSWYLSEIIDVTFSCVSSFRPAARRLLKGKCTQMWGIWWCVCEIVLSWHYREAICVCSCQGGEDRGGRGATWHRQTQPEPKLWWKQAAERSVGCCSTAGAKWSVRL